MKNASIALLCEMHRQLGEVVVQLVEQFSLPELQKKHILEELSSSAVGGASVTASSVASSVGETPVSASVTSPPTEMVAPVTTTPTNTPEIPSTTQPTPSQPTTPPPSLTSLLDPVDLSDEVLLTPCVHRRSKPSFPP